MGKGDIIAGVAGLTLVGSAVAYNIHANNQYLAAKEERERTAQKVAHTLVITPEQVQTISAYERLLRQLDQQVMEITGGKEHVYDGKPFVSGSALYPMIGVPEDPE